MLEQLAEGQAEQIFQKVLEGALGGEGPYQKMLMDRIWPPRKAQPIVRVECRRRAAMGEALQRSCPRPAARRRIRPRSSETSYAIRKLEGRLSCSMRNVSFLVPRSREKMTDASCIRSKCSVRSRSPASR